MFPEAQIHFVWCNVFQSPTNTEERGGKGGEGEVGGGEGDAILRIKAENILEKIGNKKGETRY
jgi:hypothetical protein